MKKLRRIALSFVLALVLCFPVFFAVGCGENSNENEKMTYASVAKDSAEKLGAFYDTLISCYNTTRAELDSVDMDVEDPDYDLVEELEYKLEDIQYFIEGFSQTAEGAIFPLLALDGLKFGKLYDFDIFFAQGNKTDGGIEIVTDGFSTQYIYSQNKLSKIVNVVSQYTTYTQMPAEWEGQRQWAEKNVYGLNNVEIEVLDFSTNSAYVVSAEAYVDEYADEYYNGLEEFVGAFNAGNMTYEDLDRIFSGMDLYVTYFDGEDLYFDIFDFDVLRTLKKQIRQINIAEFNFNIFDDIDSVEIDMRKMFEKISEIYNDQNYELVGGYYVKNGDTLRTYEKICSIMEDVVAAATEYKDWVDSFGEMEGDLPEYTACDIEIYEVNNEEAVESLQRGLNYLKSEAGIEEWESFGLPVLVAPGQEITYPIIDFDYVESSEEAAEQADRITRFSKLSIEYVDEKFYYTYDFSADWEGDFELSITIDEDGNLKGFTFGIYWILN